MTVNIMSTRRSLMKKLVSLLVLEPPRHTGLGSIVLVPGRHLVGSAAECDIQLPLEGIGERHALVLVGENRTVVKSMDAHTWVNEGPVTETTLRPGDRLSFGPLTFRIRVANEEELTSLQEPPADEMARPLTHQVKWLAESRETNRPAGRTSEEQQIVDWFGELPWKGTAGTHPVAPAKPAPTPAREPVPPKPSADADLVEARLDEIQQRLSQLQQAAQPVSESAESSRTRTEEDWRKLQQRQELLDQRAAQLAHDSQKLQQQLSDVAAQEARVQARHDQLAQEAERLEQIAESTRRQLSEEHTQREAVWVEWESAYQRMSGQLTSQLDAIEQHRVTLQAEADRLADGRRELKSTQSAHELDRQAFDAASLRQAQEHHKLVTLKEQVAADQRRLQKQIAEFDARLQADRNELKQGQANLIQARTQLDQERRALVAQWSEQTRRMEEEYDRCAALQARLDDDQQRQLVERGELAAQLAELQRQRSRLDRERLEFQVAQGNTQQTLVQLEELKARLQEAEDELAQARRNAELPESSLQQSSPVPICELPFSVSPPPLPGAVMEDSVLAMDDADDPPTVFSIAQHIDGPSRSEIVTDEPDPLESIAEEPGDFSAILKWNSLTVQKDLTAVEVDEVRDDKIVGEPPTVSMTETTEAPVEIEVLQVAEPQAEVPGDDSSMPYRATLTNGEDHPSVTSETDFSKRESESPAANEAPVQDTSPWSIPAPNLPADRYEANPGYFPELGTWSEPEQTPGEQESHSDTSPYDSPAADAADPWSYFGATGHFPESSPTNIPGFNPLFPADAGQEALSRSLVANSTLQMGDVEGTTDPSKTLAEVNREFGAPAPENESQSDLPSWWMQTPQAPVDSSEPEFAVPATPPSSLAPSEAFNRAPAAEGHDLRSQLAMLFDLPRTAEPDNSDAPNASNEGSAPAEVRESASEIGPAGAGKETPGQVDSDPSVDAAPEQRSDSVEEFMARLLARSRGEPVAPPAAAVVAPEAATHQESQLMMASDRSHLMAEPKHKQDRQAVRENLQSFRQVAHLSARSALARHSLQQLRNATIAKGVLLGASSLAAIWFILEPLSGRPLQIWKGAVCVLAAALSGVEFSRSWMQWRKPAANSSLPAGDPDSDADLALDEAMADGAEPGDQTERDSDATIVEGPIPAVANLTAELAAMDPDDSCEEGDKTEIMTLEDLARIQSAGGAAAEVPPPAD